MKVEQVLQLIQAVSDSELTEFKYEEDGVELSLKKTGDKIVQVQAPAVAPAVVQAAPAVIPAPAPVPAAPAPAAEAPAAGGAAGAEEELPAGNIVKSPLVGTFYAAPAEDAEPFVKVGDTVKKGDVLFIIESMKLMNEVNSEVDGVVTKILVEDGQGVEFHQPILIVE